MTQNLMPKQYVGITVTLTDKDTAYNLADLLTAIDSACPLTGKEVSLQVAAAPSGTVSVGDAEVAAGRMGYSLASGASRIYRSRVDDIPVGMIWLMGSVDAMLVNVEVIQ